MPYAFLSSPMSPFLQRKVNELYRLRAPKTIKTLLEHLVKTVEDSESIQNSFKDAQRSEGLAEVLSDHEAEEDVFGLENEEEGAPEVENPEVENPEVIAVKSSRPIGTAHALPSGPQVPIEDSGVDGAPEVPDDVQMVLEHLLSKVALPEPESSSSTSPVALTSSGSLNSSLLVSPGTASPQDLDFSSFVEEASSTEGAPPPKKSRLVSSCASDDPDEVAPEIYVDSSSPGPVMTLEPIRDQSASPGPVMTPEPIRDQEIPRIHSEEVKAPEAPPIPRALSFSLSEDSSDDEGCAKKLTSSGSAPPPDSDSDDSSDDRPRYSYSSDDQTSSPPPKRRPLICSSSSESSDSDSSDSDSSDSEDDIDTIQKSGSPVNQMAAPAALPASPRPVMTPEPTDDMENTTINVSQTINLSILLNQDTPASTPIPSLSFVPNTSGTHPPSMKKTRASNCYEHIVSMCEYMKTDLCSLQIEALQQDLKARNRLYQRYVEEGRLQPTEPNNRSRQEHLPIYVFLMAPKTKKSYLDGFKNDKIPINATFHESIFKASMKNDENTVQLLQIYFLSPATGRTKAKWVNRQARAVAEGKEFRVEADVIGVIKVESLDKVPDGSCFACFEKMPPISDLQSKSLNCVVMNPSDQDHILILQQPGVKVPINLEGLSIGKSPNPACKCFGPKVQAPTVIPKIFDNLASLFHRILYNKKGHANDDIYVVEGFW